MNGGQDLSNLFQRVTALEQEDADSDVSVAQIVKFYPRLGIRVTMNYWLHQYWFCGDENPLNMGVCGTDRYI